MDNNGYIYIIFLPHIFSDHIDSVINDYKKYYKKFTRYIKQYVTEIEIESTKDNLIKNRLHFTFNICNNIENIFNSFIEKYRNVKKYYLYTGLHSSDLLFDMIYFTTDIENNIIYCNGFLNCFIDSLDNDYIIDKKNNKIKMIFSNNSYCINNEKIKSICKKYLNKLEEIKNV